MNLVNALDASEATAFLHQSKTQRKPLADINMNTTTNDKPLDTKSSLLKTENGMEGSPDERVCTTDPGLSWDFFIFSMYSASLDFF